MGDLKQILRLFVYFFDVVTIQKKKMQPGLISFQILATTEKLVIDF